MWTLRCALCITLQPSSVARTMGVFLFVNSAGKVWLLKTTLFALECGNGRMEVVASHRILPHASVLPADLQVAHGVVDERHLRKRLLPYFETQWTAVDAKNIIDTKRKLAQRAKEKASEGFQCKRCKSTETSQRRYERSTTWQRSGSHTSMQTRSRWNKVTL